LVYLRTSTSGVWDSGNTWNREHVWPQSLLGVSADNATVNSASDLYNLMPANPGENSSIGNSPYSEMGLGYEPRDEVKGDVARALFYMMIMYDELNLVDDAPGIHEMGYLNELLQWHLDDPVDDFELARLEVIFSYQSNRNPFVDYPHFVDLIWFYVQ
jgi:endonuclease I